MTWAEAKAKSNPGGSNGTKAKVQTKNVPHNQILAQKIIAKQGGPKEKTISKAKLRRAQREDEKAAAAIAAAREEEIRERRSRTVKPHEVAKERMAKIAQDLQKLSLSAESLWDANSMEQMNEIKECRDMQLDEIMALEAIYTGTDEFLVSEASRLEELREIRDALSADEEDETALRSFVEHPPLSFSIQLTVEDTREDAEPEMDLVASIVLSVKLPSHYPLQGATPDFQLSDIMITDKNAVCSPDKTLESLAFVDQKKLLNDMVKEATLLLPDPSVYEIVTWLSENAFEESLQMRTHALIS